MPPPYPLVAVQELHEMDARVRTELEVNVTEIAPPDPDSDEQLVKVIPVKVSAPESEAYSNTAPSPSYRLMEEKVVSVLVKVPDPRLRSG